MSTEQGPATIDDWDRLFRGQVKADRYVGMEVHHAYAAADDDARVVLIRSVEPGTTIDPVLRSGRLSLVAVNGLVVRAYIER